MTSYVCDKVINATLSSDCIDGTQATNVPFVVVRSAVSATMDMGVGYSGLVCSKFVFGWSIVIDYCY